MIIRFNEKNFVFASLFLLIFGLGFSQNSYILQLKKFQKEIDSIEISSDDFNKLKQHFNNNKKVLKLISENATQGSKSHKKLLELLELSFDEAKAKHGERNIKTLILSYQKSNEILGKFKKLDSSFQAKNDSIKMNQKSSSKKIAFSDEIKRDLENYKKRIDSLKKN